MGSSCSSRQRLKDKDSNSTKSEESATYQVIGKKYSEEKTLITAQQKNHTGVINRSAESETKGGTLPSRNAASSVSDTISLPSPPTLSPRELTEPPLLQELTQLPESFQNFLTGRAIETEQSIKTRKIVLYVCAADSQDFCVEKGVLHEVVGPELRNYCRDKGYELHITDLHWKTDLEKQYSHEFSELCVGELRRQMEVGYIIPVLFLSNSLGAPLLPKTVEAKNFEMALAQAEDKDILKKWYKLDPDSSPKCYELVPVSTYINGLKRNSLEQEEKLLQQWRNEAEKLLASMVTSFSEELRNTCLSTVMEQELQNTVFCSQELARRCLWLYRVFTQRPEAPQTSVIELEQKRRLDILYKELRSRLTEKHIVRISLKWNSDGVVDKSLPEHAQYISDVTSNLMKYLKATIFNIIEEDQSKAVIRSTYGIESSLLNEIKWQNLFCQKLAARTLKRDSVLQQIQSYITSDSTFPLLVHGVQGSGKTAILSKAIHLLQTWAPDSYLLFRFAKISELSHSLIDILKSVCDHLSLLGHGHQTLCAYNLNNYGKSFLELISAITLQRSVVVVLDGLDHIKIADLDWLPHKLPNNAKLIVSANTDSFLFRQLKSKLQTDRCLVQVPELNRAEAESHFLSALSGFGGVVNKKAAKPFLSFLDSNPLSLHVKVLAWRISWFFENEAEFGITNNSAEEINSLLDCVENILGKNRVTIALSIILASKYGLLDSELLDMLSHEPIFHSEKSHIKWAPAYLFISLLFKYLNIFFHWVSDGNYLTLKFNENTFEEIVKQRYVKRNKIYNELIQSYFKGIWCTEKNRSLAGKYLNQPNKTDKSYNKRKLVELPHQTILLKQNPVDEFFLNPKWLFDKICGCGVFQVLEDIVEYSAESRLSKDVETLKTILENTHEALNYDGRQMYTQFREELKHLNLEESLFWKSFYEKTEKPDTNSLMPVPKRMLLAGSLGQSPSNDSGQIPMVNVNLIVRLIENPYFVVSVSTEKEEISVWDLSICEKVRCLKGVTHPISLQLIDDVRAVVLCRRELRIYNLDEGTLVTKLKGVMNQKMAYYGLHDKNHVVTLSRNRMYVNLMHLESGDCITTFKAGEDRFLNSLLVSGDGRILVCGDETQKPFPLLVWNLSSRKLLYDLRIPHHDFITSLSAITHEGHYVCCVAKEAVEPGPNFIVVYDLQNGTLFKKWKPGVDTTSLDISSKDSCVISGLADARILVWDLVTGNCRWSLRGHSAPVTLVRRDPCGGCFMSADILNRDRSIRLWDLNKGELLAVYTPPKPFTACELGIGGKVIALSLRGEDDLTSLILKGPGIEPIENKSHYGKKENHGKTFTFTEGQDGS